MTFFAATPPILLEDPSPEIPEPARETKDEANLPYYFALDSSLRRLARKQLTSNKLTKDDLIDVGLAFLRTSTNERNFVEVYRILMDSFSKEKPNVSLDITKLLKEVNVEQKIDV